MPSPFPGMDPYLETQPRWEMFHAWFIRKLAELALPRASEFGCWIDVERDVYREDPSGAKVLIGEPDDAFIVSTTTLGSSANGAATATLAVPRSVREVSFNPRSRRRRQQYLVVRAKQRWPQVLAVAEVLSPANKDGEYAKIYNAKRDKLLASRSHFLEIDLLRGGKNPLRAHFDDLPATPYFSFVARKTDIGRTEEAYPIRLQDPLPTIGLPLGGGRPDLPIDLAGAFRAAYDLSMGGDPVDYATEAVPEPNLTAEDAAWVANLLAAIR